MYAHSWISEMDFMVLIKSVSFRINAEDESIELHS